MSTRRARSCCSYPYWLNISATNTSTSLILGIYVQCPVSFHLPPTGPMMKSILTMKPHHLPNATC
eukprot:scaffold547233_cov32-Prasinocladus_malaysianus.AAC.1